MKEALALKTIGALLDWGDEATKEFSKLRVLSQYKYDAYEGYEPGIRFYANLIIWLKQFQSGSDRKVAYDFLMNHLIFFSRQEVIHLVHRYWPKVKSTIIKEISKDMGVPPWEVLSNEAAKQAFNVQLRQSIFVGLSDGAKMDVFRRDNEGRVSNEQTLVAYQIPQEKWQEMQCELKNSLTELNASGIEPTFKHIFLIDDFTASGTSLIKFNEEKGEWGGKIPSFITQIDKHHDLFSSVIKIHVHHYIATQKSKDLSQELAQKYFEDQPKYQVDLTFGLILDDKLNLSKDSNKEFYDLVTKHYDESVQTEISKCVRYGYKEGHLAVVFEHNTPNNSVGLIWAETKKENAVKLSVATPMSPLFRRRTRHS